MQYKNLPEEVKVFITQVQKLRDLQKRYFLATTRNTAMNDERFQILKECKKQELDIDKSIVDLKNNYTQLEIT
jgi:hypothetical protein